MKTDTTRFIIEDGDGNEITLPTRREVCPRCDGYGVHDHPAFANGISSDQFDEDPDFREDYFRGRYDVTCEECGGKCVVDVPDEDRMTPEQKALWIDHCRAESEYRATVAAERRMGA